DRMFRKHQYKDFGVINRPDHLVCVLRPGCYITRRNPALDPVPLEILDDGIGNCSILRGIAHENWRGRARRLRVRLRGLSYLAILRHTAPPTAVFAVSGIPSP